LTGPIPSRDGDGVFKAPPQLPTSDNEVKTEEEKVQPAVSQEQRSQKFLHPTISQARGQFEMMPKTPTHARSPSVGANSAG